MSQTMAIISEPLKIGATDLLIGVKCSHKDVLYVHMEKRTFGEPWKQRYVILSEGCLYIYKNKRSKKPKEAYSLKHFVYVGESEPRNGEQICFCLHYRNGNPPKLFACDTRETREEWIEKLRSTMSDVQSKFFISADSGFGSAGIVPAFRESDTYETDELDEDGLKYDKVDERLFGQAFQLGISHSMKTDSMYANVEDLHKGISHSMKTESMYANVEDLHKDVEDEQNSQDTPSDEKGHVDQTEDREENYTYLQRRHLRKYTVRCMKNGILPDQRLLNDLCLEFGRKSKFLVHTCHNISKHIKALDENILHVWAAYTVKDRNKITFVVVVKENVRLEKTIKYSFVKRVVNEYSLEAEQVMYSKKKVAVDQHDLQRLKTSISNHATELMRRHKYLSIISGSSVRSRNYGNDKAKAVDLVAQPCIVLYVHTKHFIPIDEEPFEEHYDGVPVDVREGEFVPFVLATEYHDSLKHSCQIGSSPDRSPKHHIVRIGSLGCFIDHPEYNLCGLTCAHVLLFPWGLEKVEADEDEMLRWPLFKPHDQVFQPASTNNAIGQLVQVIYHKGGSRTCGMEVALFQIDQRQPVSGGFPTMKNAGGVEEMPFDSGKSCGISHIGDGVAIKFGPVTDKTVGKFDFETDTTSVKTIKHEWDDDEFRITLHKQLCVHAEDSNGHLMPFADEGDSGSLVFKKEENGNLVAVGIVEGGTSFRTTVVTPIKPILQKLGIQSIKSFEKDQLIQQLRNIPNEIDSKLKNFETSLLGKISELIKGGSAGNS